MIPKLKSCGCCGCSLQTGARVFSTLLVIMRLLGFGIAVSVSLEYIDKETYTVISELMDMAKTGCKADVSCVSGFCYHNNHYDNYRWAMKDRLNHLLAVKLQGSLPVVLVFVAFIFSIVLCFGVFNKNAALMLPHIVMSGLLLIVAMIIQAVLLLFSIFFAALLIIFILMFFLSGLELYSWLVLYSFYSELKPPRRTTRSTGEIHTV